MSSAQDQMNYMHQILQQKILEKFPFEKSLNFDWLRNEDLSGFMSAIYMCEMKTEHTVENREIDRKLIVKFMKGDENFRKFGRVYIQFVNEIFIYRTLIPYYEMVAKDSPHCTIDVRKWIPTVFWAEYGDIEGLSRGSPEFCLVLENINPYGFRCGPRLHFDRQHLLLMAKVLGEYHAFTYALKIREDPKLENLIADIIPLSFTVDDGANLYQAVYNPGFERFFKYVDRVKSKIQDKKFVNNLERFEKRYGDNPIELLERFRVVDETFSVILHGDYNRNNVLFRYDQDDGFANPQDVRMIDFQELRFGSPAIDLAFFMYMNMDPLIREDFWMELLEYYHQIVIDSVCNILGLDCSKEHDSLGPYSFENFYTHFSKFAFYGALISIHFLPWMACSEEECAWISELFEKDMFSDEFKKAIQVIGGDSPSEMVLEIVHHASRLGYMDNIFN